MKSIRNLGTMLAFALIITAFSVSKPKVLIIGDSISMGYTPFVTEHFSDKVLIAHNPGNARDSGFGLQRINEWIGDEDWDIIQFNWGLWDFCYRHPASKVQGNRDKISGKITFTLEDYGSKLDSLATILKQSTEARLIFVTTSYVPKNEAGRFEEDAIKYNDTAIKIMQKHSIMVNDIYERSISIHNEFGLGSDDVHYTKEGYRELSKLIINFLAKEIETFKND